MTKTVDIGLPSISEEAVEGLAEECELQISKFLLKKIPQKSIEDLFISCTLTLLDNQLDVDIEIDVGQGFDTGHAIDDIVQEAIDWGADWLEKRLLEMKQK